MAFDEIYVFNVMWRMPGELHAVKPAIEMVIKYSDKSIFANSVL